MKKNIFLVIFNKLYSSSLKFFLLTCSCLVPLMRFFLPSTGRLDPQCKTLLSAVIGLTWSILELFVDSLSDPCWHKCWHKFRMSCFLSNKLYSWEVEPLKHNVGMMNSLLIVLGGCGILSVVSFLYWFCPYLEALFFPRFGNEFKSRVNYFTF